MKICIGPYIRFIGPYQIAEWLKPIGISDKYSEKIGDFLSYIKLHKFCDWIYSKRKRTVKIKIHNYDTWNSDNTLALVIAPILKQLKKNSHGYPEIDVDDVPTELLETLPEPKIHGQLMWELGWNYILDEMIWTFEQYADDWEEPFYKIDSPHIRAFDKAGYDKHLDRMKNGTRLFGKYYSNLWD